MGVLEGTFRGHRGVQRFIEGQPAILVDLRAEPETIPTGDWPESGPIRGGEAAWDFYVDIDESWEGAGRT
jgi:hypothetical protein